MTTKRRTLITLICALAMLANVAGVGAQTWQEKDGKKVVVQGQNHVFVAEPGQMAMAGAQGDNTFVFVSSEMSIDGKLVKGAPYSAQAVNESIQNLPGNRIVRQNTSTIYRDSEGRTRREQTISVVGGFAAAGEPAQTTFINDPVAGVNYILDAKNKTARKIDYSARMAAEKKAVEAKMEAMKAKAADGASQSDKMAVDRVVAEKIAAEKAAGGFKFEMRTGGPGMGPVVAGGGAGGFVMMRTDSKNTKKESLGTQTVEGVSAEGTRFTTTIPAGEIGNELPIEILFESWYSPELQTVVMTKSSDPRTGENTYRLTNINRAEPAHALFEVPPDYTIQEGGPSPEMRYRIETDARRPGANQ